MKLRFTLLLFGIYLGILLMAIATLADVGWAKLEKPIKVMVIDTGIAKLHPGFKNVNITCKSANDCVDFNGHGTSVTSAILFGEISSTGEPTTPVCNKVQVYVCSYFVLKSASDRQYLDCLRRAIEEPVNFINFSSTSNAFDPVEHRLMLRLANLGTKIITAMGNDGQDVMENPTYPAVLSMRFDLKNTIIPVKAKTRTGERFVESNFGIPGPSELGVNVRVYTRNGVGLASGTSLSAALHTNRLLREACNKL